MVEKIKYIIGDTLMNIWNHFGFEYKSELFLAAMSSSRSDVVTQFVCSFVHSFVRSFVMKEFLFSLRSCKGVSRSLMCVSMKYQGYFM